MKISLFFTFDQSLVNWENTGILDRELEYYKLLNRKYKINFNFITYGDISDISILKQYDFINVYPLYKEINRNNFILYRILKSFLIIFYFSKAIKESSILKSNQINGSWMPAICSLIFNKPFLCRGGYLWYKFSTLAKENFFKKLFIYFISLISYKFSDKIHVCNLSDKNYILEKFNVI